MVTALERGVVGSGVSGREMEYDSGSGAKRPEENKDEYPKVAIRVDGGVATKTLRLQWFCTLGERLATLT